MKLFKLILTPFLLFFLTATTTWAAAICIPESDPWFTVSLNIAPATLPEGVKIVYDDTYLYKYALINNSAEPLYIVKENTNGDSFPRSEIPVNFKPLFELVSGKIYCYSEGVPKQTPPDNDSSDYIISGPNSTCAGFAKPEGWNNDDRPYFDIGRYIWYFEKGLINIPEGDNRPPNIEIPLPQNFKILAYFRGNPIELQGKIVYSLNDNYDPHTKENSKCPVYNSNSSFVGQSTGRIISLIIQIIVVLAFLALVSMIILSLCGMAIDRFKWSKKIMEVLIILMVVVYVYFDYNLVNLMHFDNSKYNFNVNITFLSVIGLFQIFIIFKLNDYVLDWLKSKSVQGYISKTNWKKLFFISLIGLIGIIYFIISVLANLFSIY